METGKQKVPKKSFSPEFLESIDRAERDVRAGRLRSVPNLAGVLKGRLPKNAVTWQREIRKEWER